jgi:hypothetical protein
VALTHTTTHGTGGASSSSATGGAGGSVEPPPITGTYLDTHITDTGDVPTPRDPAELQISARVRRPDGGWDTYPGTLDASGTFTISGVPLGEAQIVVAWIGAAAAPEITNIEVTSERVAHFGLAPLGRTDAVASTLPTPVTLDVTGTDGWDPTTGRIDFVSLGAGVRWPASCSTGLAECFTGTAAPGPNLVDASKGDQVWLLHRTEYWDADATDGSLTHALHSTTFTEHDGVAATLSGVFVPVPQQHLLLPFDAAAFTAQANQILATSTPLFAGARMDIVQNLSPLIARLGEVARPVTAGSLDLLYGALDLGRRPLVTFAVEVKDGARFGGVGLTGSLEAFAQTPLSPLVGAPRDVRIDGHPIDAAPSGLGSSPTLSWTAPALGTPDAYSALIMCEQGGRSVFIRTRDTEVSLPPGSLSGGSCRVSLSATQLDPQTGRTGYAYIEGGSFSP